MDDKLNTFIAHARSKGMDHATIRLLLVSAGWREKEIAAAMATEGLDLPVPEPVHAGGARDAFLYLLTFSSLYAVVIAGIVVYFQYLNQLLPDPAWSNDGADYYVEAMLDTIRWSLAVILVAFPVFYFLTRSLEREVRADPDKQKRPVRRWLTYLTLFAAAVTIMGDLMSLLYYLLEGELTTRFILKALVLLVIAGLVFAYYLITIRPTADQRASRGPRLVLSALALLLVAGALVEGFGITGSPMSARLRRIDERRVSDLRVIHDAIQAMVSERVESKERPAEVGEPDDLASARYRLKRPLPRDLEEVAQFQRTRQYGRAPNLIDPETNEPYGYSVKDENRYELCNSFATRRQKRSDQFWNHPAGRHCYEIDIRNPP